MSTLTERETQALATSWQFMKTLPEVDYNELGKALNITGKSARNMMYGIRNKLVTQYVRKDLPADHGEMSTGEKADGDEKTPKPRANAKKVNGRVKATEKTSGKSAISRDEINHEDGEMPVEVPSTPLNESPILTKTPPKRASPTKRKAKNAVSDEFGGELLQPAKKVKQSESDADK